MRYYYRPQRSCGQGNVFTGVCLSTGGESVCISACWDARPPWTRHPPGTRQTPPGLGRPPWTRQTPHPPDQADQPGPGRPLPLDQAEPPGPGRPPRPGRHLPGKQTPAYGLRAAGTHPTGMHSCLEFFLKISLRRSCTDDKNDKIQKTTDGCFLGHTLKVTLIWVHCTVPPSHGFMNDFRVKTSGLEI